MVLLIMLFMFCELLVRIYLLNIYVICQLLTAFDDYGQTSDLEFMDEQGIFVLIIQ